MATVDLSDLQNNERLEKLNAAFDGLNGRETLVVTCNQDYYETIAEFQKQKKGSFFWAALRNGPDLWKGELVNTEGTNVTKSLFSYMDMDHKRCDQLYADGESLIFDKKKEEGIEVIKEFLVGMKRHFVIEERIMFPAFEENTGMTQGPTMVMRMEHEQMKGLLSQMQSAVDTNDPESITGIGETLVVLMQQHNIKEEGMLYPMMDQHLGHLIDDLIERTQAVDFQS